MKYNIPTALQKLKPGAEWILRGGDYSDLEWVDNKQTKPTKTQKLTKSTHKTNNTKQKQQKT